MGKSQESRHLCRFVGFLASIPESPRPMKLCKKLRALPPFEELNRLFSYCPETGNLLWRVRSGKAAAGSIAGGLTELGYLRVWACSRKILVHRVVWLLFYGYEPAGLLDHINRDRSDNRIQNLRLASASENQRNSGISNNNTSGIKGVSWDKNRSRWQAYLNNKPLGRFKNLAEAGACVRAAREKAHGVFSCHG